MTKIAKSGVTTSAVATALGTTSHDLGTLCSHENIKWFAKYKPESFNTTSHITDEQRKSNNWSLKIHSGSSISGMTTAVDKNVNGGVGSGITYTMPLGGFRSPYRLGDFAGYDNETLSPVEPFFKTQVKYYPSGGWADIEPFYTDNLGDSDWISRADLYSYYDEKEGVTKLMNYGVAMRLSTGTTRWSVGGIPWKESAWSNFLGKNVYIYEFFTNIPVGTISTQYTFSGNELFYPLPKCRSYVPVQIGIFEESANTSDFTTVVALTLDGKRLSGNLTLNSKDRYGMTYTGATNGISKITLEVRAGESSTTILTSTTWSNRTLGAEQELQLAVALTVPDAYADYMDLWCKVKIQKTGESTASVRYNGIIKVVSKLE